MGNAINQDAAYLWRWMCRDGGWWSLKDLQLHWSPTFYEDEIRDAINALVKGGFIAKREQHGGRHLYAHTSECNPLPGAAATHQPGAIV